MKQLLRQIGLEAERIRMVNISAAMATVFVEAVTEMVGQIQELGHNPLRTDQPADVTSNNVEGEA